MASTDLKRRIRKEVTIYFGALPLMLGGIYSPFVITGILPKYIVLATMLVGIGAIVILLARIGLDPASTLSKRILGYFALGLATGIFAYEAGWAELLHAWYQYAIAFAGYAFACWCISRVVDLRVDQWRHDEDLPSNTSLERTRER